MAQEINNQLNDLGVAELSDEELEKARGGALPPGLIAADGEPINNDCTLPPGGIVARKPARKKLFSRVR